MSPKLIAVAVGLSALAFSLGWYKSSVDVGAVPDLNDNWSDGAYVNRPQTASTYATLLSAINANQILPMSAEDSAAAVSTAGQGGEVDPSDPSYVPPFPEIVSVSEINGETRVHLRLDDETVQYAVAGQRLDSGWQLKTVDLTHIVAVFDEEERHIAIGYAAQDEAEAPSSQPEL